MTSPVVKTHPSTHAEGGGIYVWGRSRYSPDPSQDVLITDNVIRVQGRGVFLNGVENGRLEGNLIKTGESAQRVVLQRTEDVQVDSDPDNRQMQPPK